MTTILLSVVLPTYNRKDYLKLTLDTFSPQIERHKDEVTFCICNNASTDGTDKFLEEYCGKHKCFDYINFADHVDVGYSITRANNTAKGKYILMWGDDDIPVHYLIDILLDTIKKYKDAGIVHYNRLMGYDDQVQRINNMKVNDNHILCMMEGFNTTNEFLNHHALDITFLSSFIFLSSLWHQNTVVEEVKTDTHFGYEFLGKILYGLKNHKIYYITYPLCIQRKPFNRPWMNRSPYYRFIGIPNMYADFERWVIITSAQDLWNKQGNGKRDFFAIMSQTSIFKKDYRPIWRQMLKSQPSTTRKLWTLVFIFLFPDFIYKLTRKLVFK